ncbi:MAG: beta-mannosidase [Chitinispirillia bacterium]|nr:beta-mannosidase [Chitinispirillia bacterium]MCL2267951.1 beta-mannosidase [Chitinispirillia bacterium]
MTKKVFTRMIAASATVMLAASALFADLAKYEAEAFVTNETMTPKVAHESASGGQYVQMREGDLTFTVTAPAAGFYTIWARYSQTYDNAKTQNLVVNGSPAGTITFPLTSAAVDDPAPVFAIFKAVGKVRLTAGANTIGITRSWGWVDIDYIEVGPFEPVPFTLTTRLVTPNASENARKVFQFLRENFQTKVISGVQTSTVMRNTGGYVSNSIDDQAEMSHIKGASGKFPALMGLDFIHGTGEQANRPNGGGDWFIGYNNATLALAEEFFNKGGIPIYCWHWRDPLRISTSDGSFYTENTTFDLTKAFTDATYDKFDENSAEYKAMLSDIDEVAGFLKRLADKNVPVLWRPVHEAAGGWFWWGAKGPKPLAQLWRLMFDRLVKHHGLDNLIWVWTTEESGRELEWYPGAEYVDIIGRDWYPPQNQQAKMHGSLVANFENIKGIFGTDKIIALSENGPVPHPDSLVSDGAQWSWFMTWDRDFTTTVNTVSEWNYIMNHNYVITLEDMPGWGNYGVTSVRNNNGTAMKAAPGAISIRSHRGALELRISGTGVRSAELFNLKGAKVAALSGERLTGGNYRFPVKGIAKQMYIVRVKTGDNRVVTLPVRIE